MNKLFNFLWASLLPMCYVTEGFVLQQSRPQPSKFIGEVYTPPSRSLKMSSSADFEYSELRIQLKAMKEQNVVTSQLALPKKIELEGYVKRVANRRSSPIKLYEMADYLPNSKWYLAFTTQTLTTELPKDARIRLEFHESSDDFTTGKLDYILQFTKTFGLKRLVAKSSYTADKSPVNPGLVTFSYDSITTDVFGLSNVNVGLFGLLQGRSNYIPTQYFDDSIWIEVGVDPTTGGDYYNVYLKE